MAMLNSAWAPARFSTSASGEKSPSAWSNTARLIPAAFAVGQKACTHSAGDWLANDADAAVSSPAIARAAAIATLRRMFVVAFSIPLSAFRQDSPGYLAFLR